MIYHNHRLTFSEFAKSIYQSWQIKDFAKESLKGVDPNSAEYQKIRSYNQYIEMTHIIFTKNRIIAKIRIPEKTLTVFSQDPRLFAIANRVKRMNPDYIFSGLDCTGPYYIILVGSKK